MEVTESEDDPASSKENDFQHKSASKRTPQNYHSSGSNHSNSGRGRRSADSPPSSPSAEERRAHQDFKARVKVSSPNTSRSDSRGQYRRTLSEGSRHGGEDDDSDRVLKTQQVQVLTKTAMTGTEMAWTSGWVQGKSRGHGDEVGAAVAQ